MLRPRFQLGARMGAPKLALSNRSRICILSLCCEYDSRMTVATIFGHRCVSNASLLRFVQQWQTYFKERTGSDGALHTYLTAVSLDNPLHNGQAQPAAAWLNTPWLAAQCSPFLPARARLIHAIEALKDIGQVLLGDARAVILHAHEAPALLFTGQFHIHTLPDAAGIFDSVLDQIGQHLSQILWIAAHRHFRQVSGRQGHVALLG